MSLLGLTLFLGVALSITAIPVLGRIMMELNVTRTRLGAITITAAAVDDAIGWILLASVTAVVKSDFDPLETLRMAGSTVGFALLMWFAVRPLLVRYFVYSLRANRGRLSATGLAVLLVSVLSDHSVADWQKLGPTHNVAVSELVSEHEGKWQALRIHARVVEE